MEITVGYETETMEEDFPARDRKDGVIYKDKHTDITIFKLEYTFGVGPIGIKLGTTVHDQLSKRGSFQNMHFLRSGSLRILFALYFIIDLLFDFEWSTISYCPLCSL